MSDALPVTWFKIVLHVFFFSASCLSYGVYWLCIVLIFIICFCWFLFSSPGAVVQLKAITGAVSGDESLSNIIVERTGILQKILVYVVSIICSFIDLDTDVFEKSQLYSWSVDFHVARWGASPKDSSNSLKVPSETRLYWHQKAVVSVMEAGGLNWFVGKVRIFFIHVLSWQVTQNSCWLMWIAIEILLLCWMWNLISLWFFFVVMIRIILS